MRHLLNTRWLWAAPIALGLSLGGAQAQTNDKRITVVLQGEPDSLDGCDAPRSGAGSVLTQNIVETLTEVDPVTGEVRPRLATSWTQVNDTTWRFTLRDGVTFHDGAPFNAENAVKSIERTMQESLACEAALKPFSGLKLTATAIDPLTLEIVVSQPEPILPVRTAGLPFTSPGTPFDTRSNAPIGTGPYTFGKWEPGVEIVLERNPDYWGEQPAVEGARYVWRSESTLRASMVKLGEADIAPNISPQDADDPELDSSYLNSETTYLRIDTLTPPLDDKRVRLALNYAFDRDGVRGALVPADELHATQIVVPSVAGHNPALDEQVRGYDPTKARELLAEARADGVPVDTEIMLYLRPAIYPNATEVMEAFLAMYQDVGLNVKLVSLEEAQARTFSNKPFDPARPPALLQSTHDNNKGDPAFSVSFKYGCEGRQSMVCSETVDQMIADAETTPVGPERVEKWQALFQHLYDDVVGDVWMYHRVGFARVSNRVNFTPSLATNSEIQLSTITFN